MDPVILQLGQQVTLSANPQPPGAQISPQWSVVPSGVVSIAPSADGMTCVVAALIPGDATVACRANTQRAYQLVTVACPVTGIAIDEEQRQMLLLALAELSLRRPGWPGWEYALRELAKRVPDGEEMLDAFRANASPPRRIDLLQSRQPPDRASVPDPPADDSNANAV